MSIGLAIAIAVAITVVRVRRQSHRLDELIERPGQQVANLQNMHTRRQADQAGTRKRDVCGSANSREVYEIW